MTSAARRASRESSSVQQPRAPVRCDSGEAESAEPVTRTEPRVRSFDQLAFDRLHDDKLAPYARIELLESAIPTRESARLSNTMDLNAKAAFLVSLIDGAVTLGDRIFVLTGLEVHDRNPVACDELVDCGHEAIVHRLEQRRRRNRMTEIIAQEVTEAA